MIVLESFLLVLLQAVLLFCAAYQYLFLLAGIRQPAQPVTPAVPRTRFAVAIPAHDEASVLPATLSCLARQSYPRDLFDVHVVADHCTDGTAEAARRGGAIAHERSELPRGRKAYPLRWLLERILATRPAYDAVAIFDADSLVNVDFLEVMDAQFRAGRRALQGQHIISNPHDSPLAAMAAVDMRLNNRLRNQARTNLGLTCRLMGDAMVLDAGLLREHGWLGESMTEDREYGYELLLRGVRVRYVPDARSDGQAASGWQQAQPQRLRWYRGVVAMQRRLAGRLLTAAVRMRSPVLLDGALELLMPSYSFLAAASVVNLARVMGFLALGLRASGLLGLAGSAILLAAWAAYPFAGLLADRAPLWAFRALLLGPVYLAWRLWIALQVRLRGNRIAWVRTRRREEMEGRPSRHS
jgi:cellulose synthase/poly-beta-1,6-N-acetylglucosamine synthase-like glycosyltransferase